MPRDPYDPQLFAGRKNDFRQINAWARNPGDRRLCSITGSPGSGKTWLLDHARAQWSGDPQFLVLYASAPRLADPHHCPGEMNRLIHDAARQCEFNPALLLDPTPAPERRMENLGQQVCRSCQERIPLLIVDGMDELASQTDRERVEDMLLAFLSGGECARALIARRDEWALTRFGLWLIEAVYPLGGFNPSDAEDQVQKRLRHRHPSAPAGFHFQGFLRSHIPEYDGSHPAMNAFLTDWIASSPSPPAPSARDLEDCLQDATGGLLSPNALRMLEVLCCRDDWSLTDLGDGGIALNDPAIMELFERGILIERPPRYQIADGFRGMARAWRRLRGLPC